MVFSVLSRVLLLVSMLPLCTQSVDVDIDTLGKITEFFRKNYETGQYAAAINVPKTQCLTFDGETFLKGEKNVRQALEQFMPTYDGTELIAAGVFEGKHSEDILMNDAYKSKLTHLLKRDLDGCVVFYTLNSPCIDSCLSNNGNSILQGLDELKEHKGIKAFAFKHVYRQDQDKFNLSEELNKVAERVPLYRCHYECILCGKPGSQTLIKEECTLTTDEFKAYINKLFNYTPSNSASASG